jgi:hypothetical protein
MLASKPLRSHLSTRTGTSLRSDPVGSPRNAAAHSGRAKKDSKYEGERMGMVRAASLAARSISRTKLEPGRKSHACTMVV